MAKSTQAVSQPITLEGLNAQGQGVRVEFLKNGDRFGHTIFGVRNGEAVPLLESVEGTPDDNAPSSPPFAELHQQGETIFLSGATTLGHWSMSVQAIDGRLLFDVACRLKNAIDRFGSTYRVAAQDYLLEPGDAVQVTIQQDSLRVVPPKSTNEQFPTTIRWRYSVRENFE